jgi:SlyX protein
VNHRGEIVSDAAELQQLIVDLQSQLAFQEHSLRAMNDALAQQQQEILVLQRQLALLKQRQDEQALRLDEGAASVDEKPPHY